MGRDHMDDRKRALVLGKFKFLYQDDTEELESTDKFQLAVIQNKLLGPVQYKDKNGKDDAVLQIYGETRPEGEGYSEPDIKIPGVLDMFTVVWCNPFGEIYIDQDIKLFEFVDIQKYSSYNDGPKSKEFCQFHTSSTSKELDGFDSAIFWSAGFLWKHFKTCGVEKWDMEFRDLVTHYKNWKDWVHEVHNLPDRDRSKNGKFSNNKFSGPASTSTHYTRNRSERSQTNLSSSSNNNNTHTANNNNNHHRRSSPPPPKKLCESSAFPSFNPAKAPPPIVAPPPGQAVTVPIAGPDGTITQVQLMTLPATPSSPGQQAKFRYINPHYPPPAYLPPTPTSATLARAGSPNSRWSSAVEDFLYRPKSRLTSGGSSTSVRDRSPRNSFPGPAKPLHTSSPVNKQTKPVDKARLLAIKELKERKKKEAIKKEKELVKKEMKRKEKVIKKEGKRKGGEEAVRRKIKLVKKVKSFKPKSVIRAPTPTKSEANDLDLPGNKIYSGVIQDWRGKFGFLISDKIDSKIFLHSKDIEQGREMAREGGIATFKILFQEKSVVGAKAVNATIHE